MDKNKVAMELLKVAKTLVGSEWSDEAERLEKLAGKAIAKGASRAISVSASFVKDTMPDDAEMTIYGGEVAKLIRDELRKVGWEVSDLNPTRIEIGLRRKEAENDRYL